METAAGRSGAFSCCVAGHRAGVSPLAQRLKRAPRLGIPALTLYAFSMENWRRPKAEIDFLMRLLREYLRKELPTIHRNNIRMLVIGRSDQLPQEVRADIDRAMEQTAGNTGRKLSWRSTTGAARSWWTR